MVNLLSRRRWEICEWSNFAVVFLQQSNSSTKTEIFSPRKSFLTTDRKSPKVNDFVRDRSLRVRIFPPSQSAVGTVTSIDSDKTVSTRWSMRWDIAWHALAFSTKPYSEATGRLDHVWPPRSLHDFRFHECTRRGRRSAIETPADSAVVYVTLETVKRLHFRRSSWFVYTLKRKLMKFSYKHPVPMRDASEDGNQMGRGKMGLEEIKSDSWLSFRTL